MHRGRPLNTKLTSTVIESHILDAIVPRLGGVLLPQEAKNERRFVATLTCPEYLHKTTLTSESISRVCTGIQNAHFLLSSLFQLDLRSSESNKSWENRFSTFFVKKLLTLRNAWAKGTLVDSLYASHEIANSRREKAQLLEQPTTVREVPASSKATPSSWVEIEEFVSVVNGWKKLVWYSAELVKVLNFLNTTLTTDHMLMQCQIACSEIRRD